MNVLSKKDALEYVQSLVGRELNPQTMRAIHRICTTSGSISSTDPETIYGVSPLPNSPNFDSPETLFIGSAFIQLFYRTSTFDGGLLFFDQNQNGSFAFGGDSFAIGGQLTEIGNPTVGYDSDLKRVIIQDIPLMVLSGIVTWPSNRYAVLLSGWEISL
jgi:hypothetical protein